MAAVFFPLPRQRKILPHEAPALWRGASLFLLRFDGPEPGHDADFVRGVHWELVDIVAGELVPLHQAGATRGKAYVPAHIAHLRDHLGGLGNQLHRLVPVGEGKALDGRPGGRMVFVQVLLLVQRPVDDRSRVRVHGGHHAAAVEIVHEFAVSDAEHGGNQIDLSALPPDGHHAHGVDGAGIDGRHCRVLGDDLLQLQQGGLFRQALIQRLQGGKIPCAELLDAPAAAALGGLGHKLGMPAQEGEHLLPVVPRHRRPVPVQKGRKPGVEADLVPKVRHVGLVVILHHDLVVPPPGEVGVPLFRGEVIHLEQVVVHIARAVFHRALPHVLEDGPAGAARLFVDGADFVQHGPVIHVEHPLDEIFCLHGSLPGASAAIQSTAIVPHPGKKRNGCALSPVRPAAGRAGPPC